MDPKQATLQSIILKLQAFWADQGCLIWQPYHTEVGAGTMNPATFLRVLGPEDWWVAYVEPSIRPTDSRYGENPNRWGHYYQFQVILKPDPGDPQERYLHSLLALGIDPAAHDIRFVEDNWEQPALGAWGLGWEVWLDGQEITQFTYFQQAGGKVLDPVSVEITYGLERILLALLGVESFVELPWNPYVTYGEVNLQSEREHSRYTFEVADVERLRTMYAEFEAEANNCLDAGLVFPAHDYVLKCSHVFNLLDGRGAVGVSERAALFARMRELARRVTDLYLEQRESEGFPWIGRWAIKRALQEAPDPGPTPERAADFLLELGSEELPAADLAMALEQLEEQVPAMLDAERLHHGGVQVMGTPRRLVVMVKDLAPQQKEQVTLQKGPPADKAFDAEGRPTQAAEGFARSRGVDLDALRVQEIDGGRYVVAEVCKPGRSADEVLAEKLPAILGGLRFEKTMRWDATQTSFSRPVRWIVALHGEHVVPLGFAGLQAGRITRLLRFSEPEMVELDSARGYLEAMEASGIVLDPSERRAKIRERAQSLAEEVGGSIPDDPALLEEVTGLVERPTALRGTFDESFLSLPRAVLVTAMRVHQRYFPVEREGKLLPYFITVRNGGDEHLDTVARGNEHVLRARFADADYFFRRDLEKPLEAYLPRLETLTFESALGSMREKTARVEALTRQLAGRYGLNAEEAETALRAAHLCKADLATQMVIEMTSLQGEMGRVYALRSGESEGVAQAIYEHYLPRYAGDALPASAPGIVLGVADRLDTLIGLFAAGHQPKGGKDPFALRRTAIGLVQILVVSGWDLDLGEGLSLAAELQPIQVRDEVVGACLEFILTREEIAFREQGHRHDAVAAVLAEQGTRPARAAAAIVELEAWRARADWMEILQAYARCARIARGEVKDVQVDPEKLVEEAEKALYQALLDIEARERRAGSVQDLLAEIEALQPAITRFFNEVLVMAEDEILRINRLALVQRVVARARGVVDLSKLEGF